jgi:hypothetical protein
MSRKTSPSLSENPARVSSLFTISYKILAQKPEQNRFSSPRSTQLAVSKEHALGIFTPSHPV